MKNFYNDSISQINESLGDISCINELGFNTFYFMFFRRDSNVSTASSARSSSSSTSTSSSSSTPKISSKSSVGKAKITHWLLKVLRSPAHNPSVMRWEDEERGIFRVVDQAELGRMWGIAKNNPDMDYEKFR